MATKTVNTDTEHKYYLTRAMLARQGACSYWQDRLRHLFGPRRIAVSRKNIRKLLHHGSGHRLTWLTWRLRFGTNDNHVYSRSIVVERHIERLLTAYNHGRLDATGLDRLYDLLNEVGDLYQRDKHDKAINGV